MRKTAIILPLFVAILFSCTPAAGPETGFRKYDDLVKLFDDWRNFQAPLFRDGVPDYSSAAMKRQQNDLVLWQKRLKRIDTTGWPVSQQVDWLLVWAEMNGLAFEHRVTRPWERDPAFYVWFYLNPSDVPEREGPTIAGAIEYPSFSQPLGYRDAHEISQRLRKAPALYARARRNLSGRARDLWHLGIRSIRSQGEELTIFSEKVRADHPDLAKAALEAKQASDEFAKWLEKQAPSKTEISGVGKDNFSWYIRNVHLMPYDWNGYRQLLERELARSHAALRLTENRNRNLPVLQKVSNPEEYDSLMRTGVRQFMDFLSENEILTVKEYMEPAMMAQVGQFAPANGLRGFFAEVDYRDPMPMRSHHFHWIDKAMSLEDPIPNPIRKRPLLYNIFDSRAEGLATAMEELMWQNGLYKDRPRGEELVWIMLAQRAARGLGGIYQHGQIMNFDKATLFASQWVPRGMLPHDGETIQGEEHFYLQQPGYETSYVSGKLQMDQLIAEYSRQKGDSFIWKQFFDEFLSKGIIPMTLIYWEMTGDRSMLDRALKKSS